MQDIELSSIFDEAIRIASKKDRLKYLNLVCKNDRELESRLRKLLDAYDNCQTFLDAPSKNDFDLQAVSHDNNGLIQNTGLLEQAGDTIGPYKLVEKIGEGGFGVVFNAKQISPINRDVALKLIKPGMDTAEVLSRFDLEKQTMAIMDHPSISKIFDAGSTNSGRPYFAMELVEGVDISRFCDEQNSNVSERLELMIKVCEGVQHAHQRGVIHRDIKPSNILVADKEGGAQPKLIDFGVAKALSWHAPQVQTRLNQKIGSPLYMSPEQAAGSLDIDVRSDVFALGAVLFELVTGTPIIDPDTLGKKSSREVFEQLRFGATPVPSQRLESQLEKSGNLSKEVLKVQSSRLRKVKGELDWIIGKAIHNDREQRYATVSEMAKDLRRFLNDEAVEAARPSKSYRFYKFVERNRTMVAIGLTIAALLLTSSLLSLWFAVQANQYARNADAAKESAMSAEALAVSAKNNAKLETEKFQSLFADVDQLVGVATKFDVDLQKKALDQLVENLLSGESKKPDSDIAIAKFPKLHAEYLFEWGYAFEDADQDEQAKRLYEKAYNLSVEENGESNRLTLDIMHRFGNASLNCASRSFIPNIGYPAEAQRSLSEGVEFVKRLIRLEESQPATSTNTGGACLLLAIYYQRLRQQDKSETAAREAIDFSNSHPGHETLLIQAHQLIHGKDKEEELKIRQANLARFEQQKSKIPMPQRLELESRVLLSTDRIYAALGRHNEIVRDRTEFIENLEKHSLSGEASISFPSRLVFYGEAFALSQKHYDAIKTYDRAISAIRQYEKVNNTNFSKNIKRQIMVALAQELMTIDQNKWALRILDELKDVDQDSIDLWNLLVQSKKMTAMTKLGDGDEAIAIGNQVLAKCESRMGELHSSSIYAMNYLCNALEANEQYERAAEIRKDAIARSEKSEFPNGIEIHKNRLSSNLIYSGQIDKALPVLNDALRLAIKRNGKKPSTFSPIQTWYIMQGIGIAHHRANKFNESEEMFKQVLKEQLAVYAEENTETIRTRGFLASMYLDDGRAAEAKTQFELADRFFANRIEAVEMKWGRQWQSFNVRFRWFANLLKRGKILEKHEEDFGPLLSRLEPLMLEQHNALTQANWKRHETLKGEMTEKCIEQIIEMYRLAGNDQLVESWQLKTSE